jgi:dTDP-4-amino-4,6-dideoxygalactose transaminase
VAKLARPAKLALDGGKPVRSRKDFLVFGAPPLGEEEIAGVTDSLRRRWIGTGPKVAAFEAAFAAYKSPASSIAQSAASKAPAPLHAVAVNSCTAALHLSILALGIKPGDEVITTPMTFCATVNAILHAGATPVLADVDPVTFNIDPAKIAGKITKKTRAILPVHFAGRACSMAAIMKIARAHKLKVIEDCAHAIETEVEGRKAGTFGDAGCFSFYATKNVTTGEGGLVLTPHATVADRLKRLALHGMSKDAWKRYSDSGYVHYDVVELGYKYNMTDLQAAIGLPQLRRVDANWRRRREIWAQYQTAFADLPVVLPAEPPTNERHAYHLYTPLVRQDARVPGRTVSQKRDFILTALTAEGIGAGVHYRALVDHPYYRKALGWKRADCPVATEIGDRTLSLPLSPALSDQDVKDVIAAFRKVLGA